MALFVVYQVLFLSIILCRGTLVHNPKSCQTTVCEQQQHITALEQRIRALEGYCQTDAEQQQHINALDQQIRALEGKQASYAFMAETRQHVIHPTDGQYMVFKNVIANVGGAYDKHTGTFVVPVSGTYAFSYHLTVRPQTGHSISAFLKQNGKIIGHALCDDQDYETCGDESVVHANTGDDIYITLTSEGDIVIKPGQMKTHFQGFLIRQD